MIQAFSIKIANNLVKREVICSEKIKIYQYGLELLIATVLNGLVVLVLSLLLGVFWPTCLLIAPFIWIRSNAGGYHAKTHLGCIVGFAITYTATILLLKNVVIDAAIQITVLALSSLVIWLIGCIKNENRPVTDEEFLKFRNKAKRITIICCIIGIIGTFFYERIFTYYVMGIAIAAGSLLVAMFINQKIKKEGRFSHDGND